MFKRNFVGRSICNWHLFSIGFGEFDLAAIISNANADNNRHILFPNLQGCLSSGYNLQHQPSLCTGGKVDRCQNVSRFDSKISCDIYALCFWY